MRRNKDQNASGAPDLPASKSEAGARRAKKRRPNASEESSNPLILEELEARVLLSTWTLQDPAALAASDVEVQELSAEEVHRISSSLGEVSPATFDDADALDGTPQQAADETRRELVFIDEGVENYDALLTGLLSNEDGQREIEVVFLSTDRDGISQISEALAGRQDVDAVHFIAHGSDGRIKLGNTDLDSNALQQRQQEIAGWAGSLDASADLLFYGCNLAASQEGKELVSTLAELTSADISASDDLSGHASLGGDWDL